MPSRDQRRAHYDQFVAHVRGLCATSRIRATLEGGRGRPATECLPLHRYLSKPVLGHGARRAHYTVASLIALERPHHPGPSSSDETTENPHKDWYRRPNLGATLADAARRRPAGAGPSEERLQTLTRLSADWLHPRLPSLLTHLLDIGCRPDWAVLLDDLAEWDFDRTAVATRWLDSYYLTRPSPTHDENDDVLEEL